MDLKLRRLQTNDENAFLEGLKEWSGEDLGWYTFIWQPGMSFKDMLDRLEKDYHGIDLAPERVPHSMLYAFVGNEIVGRVSIRHELNESLTRRNGNLGYAVAPRFRKNGYATEMFRQALLYCRNLKMPELLISCADANTPSWKIIEKFGGQLEDKFWDDEKNEFVRRYWIRSI